MVPSQVQEASRNVLANMKTIFKTKENDLTKKSKRTAENVFGKDEIPNDVDASKKAKLNDTLDILSKTVTEVGSVTPVEDFCHLLSNSVTNRLTFEVVGAQLQGVIMRMLASAFGSDINSKVVSCLQAYRKESVSRGRPGSYNQFLVRLKAALDSDSALLWLSAGEQGLGLITKGEAGGGVEEQEALQFLVPQGVAAEG